MLFPIRGILQLARGVRQPFQATAIPGGRTVSAPCPTLSVGRIAKGRAGNENRRRGESPTDILSEKCARTLA